MGDTTVVRLPSERKFGITLASLLLIVGIYAVFRNLGWRWCAVALTGSASVAAITVMAPSTLAPLNTGWFYVGDKMGKVISPLVLGVVFFGLLAPIAVVARALGRDTLRLRTRSVGSYWIDAAMPHSNAHSFESQF
jgi:hypothetical protein